MVGSGFGPDITFVGVPRSDLDDVATYADADIVILGNRVVLEVISAIARHRKDGAHGTTWDRLIAEGEEEKRPVVGFGADGPADQQAHSPLQGSEPDESDASVLPVSTAHAR